MKEGFASQSTICVWTDAAGQRHYAGIWSNQGAPSELRAAYAGFELVHQPQWDVAVAPAAKLCRSAGRLSPAIGADRSIASRASWTSRNVRLVRALAQYHLGQLEPALADLDFLVEKQAVSASVLQYRAWTLARLGKADEARAELAKYLEQAEDPSLQAYVQIVLEAWLGQLGRGRSATGRHGDGLPQNADAPVQRGLRSGTRVPSLCGVRRRAIAEVRGSRARATRRRPSHTAMTMHNNSAPMSTSPDCTAIRGSWRSWRSWNLPRAMRPCGAPMWSSSRN